MENTNLAPQKAHPAQHFLCDYLHYGHRYTPSGRRDDLWRSDEYRLAMFLELCWGRCLSGSSSSPRRIRAHLQGPFTMIRTNPFWKGQKRGIAKICRGLSGISKHPPMMRCLCRPWALYMFVKSSKWLALTQASLLMATRHLDTGLALTSLQIS